MMLAKKNAADRESTNPTAVLAGSSPRIDAIYTLRTMSPRLSTQTRYVDQVYRLVLGRRPDVVGKSAAVPQIEARPWEKEMVLKDLVVSAEYKLITAKLVSRIRV